MNVALFLEIKSEYTQHLVDTLTPYIHEGLNKIYKEAADTARKAESQNKTLLIFQKYLYDVNNWNQIQIDEETKRIKQLNGSTYELDDLVKVVIKSHIILLTYSNNISNVIAQTFYDNFSTSTLIHRCYTECAKDAHNNPYLFYHDVDPLDYKRNQIIIQQNIQAAIPRAIRKVLPFSLIMKEFLINSVNIINEPVKTQIEFVKSSSGQENKPNDASFLSQPPINPILSEKKLDPKLEKEVMQIIKSEQPKSDKDRIKQIMNIDKIISGVEQAKKSEKQTIQNQLYNTGSKNYFSPRKIPTVPQLLPLSSGNKPSYVQKSMISEKIDKKIIVAPNLEEDRTDNDIINSKLDKSEKMFVNTKFDDEPTETQTNPRTLSITTLSNGPGSMGKIDPNRVKLIEDYGNLASKKSIKRS